jgi:uncharacterized DUF497 family protein
MASTFVMPKSSSMVRWSRSRILGEDYGEPRYVALGLLESIVVSLVYAERNDQIRVISIRKALKHEARFFFSQISK